MLEYLQLFHVKNSGVKEEVIGHWDDNYATEQDHRLNPFNPTVHSKKSPRMVYCPSCKTSTNYIPCKTSKHCQTCSAKLIFQCGTCDKFYKEMKSLREHVNHVCNKEPRFSCDQCNYKSHYERTLRTHQLSKHPKWSKRVACPRCGESKQQQYIKKHMETVCGITDPEVIQQVCGESIARGNPKVCPHCERVFKRIDLYLVHKAQFGVVDKEEQSLI